MSGARWSDRQRAQIDRLCQEALDRPVPIWEEFVRASGAGDEAVIEEVLKILAAIGSGEGILEGVEWPTDSPSSSLSQEPALLGVPSPKVFGDLPSPGDRIGPYTLREQIGDGGFGVVFLASQNEPVRRQVALKVIKPGMDSRQVVARFQAERQALAMMDHPGIAKVLGGGTTKLGRPYFVMEFVKGESITKFCDRERLDIKQRLELFCSVCEAVQHAHTKGILHRDIKPANVLAGYAEGQEGVIRCKVIDFGVAKALHGNKLAQETIYSGQGNAVGTPDYMSPEQAEMGATGIDTRADVYSLGVLLYELLAGVKPFDLSGASVHKMLRIVMTEDPARPSTRLSGSADLEHLASIRRLDSKAFTSQLRGELEWITLKALKKSRDERYASPLDLARDVQRYLRGEALEAGPDSTWYRTKKLLRRYRGSAIAAAIVLFTLVAGIVGTSAGLLREAEARADLTEQLYENRIAVAEREIEQNHDLDLAARLLAECSPHLRGWEWNYLRRRLDQPSTTLTGHAGGLWDIDISPDGRRVATAGLDGDVRIWDTATAKTILRYQKHNELIIKARLLNPNALEGKDIVVKSVAFSPDGRLVASGSLGPNIRSLLKPRSWAGVVTVWDANTGEVVTEFRQQEGLTLALAFSPDGRYIASSSINSDHTFVVWDTMSGEVVHRVSGHSGHVYTLAYDPEGRWLVSGGIDGTIKLWDMQTLDLIKSIKAHSAPVMDIDFAPDSDTIASAAQDGLIRLWELPSLKLRKTMSGHTGSALSVDFHPAGNRIASSGFDQTVRLWDPDTGRLKITLRGHTDTVWDVTFSAEGDQLYSASFDYTAHVWDASEVMAPNAAQQALSLGGHEDRVNAVTYSPDGSVIATGSWDNDVRLWRITTGELLGTLSGHTGAVWGVDYSEDGRMLVSAGWDQRAIVWDTQSQKQIMEFGGHDAPVHCAAFVPGQQWIVTAGWDGIVNVWDIDSHSIIHRFDAALWMPVLGIDVSDDGKLLATAAGDQFITVFELSSGSVLYKFKHHDNSLNQIAFSPDAKHLVVSCWDHTATVWNVDTESQTGEATLAATLTGHSDRVYGVEYSPDGRFIATSSHDKTVQLWDAETGQPVGDPIYHRGTVWDVTFSPTGRALAAATWTESGWTQISPIDLSAGDVNRRKNSANDP